MKPSLTPPRTAGVGPSPVPTRPSTTSSNGASPKAKSCGENGAPAALSPIDARGEWRFGPTDGGALVPTLMDGPSTLQLSLKDREQLFLYRAYAKIPPSAYIEGGGKGGAGKV